MQPLLSLARRDRKRRERRPHVHHVRGWRSVLYYLYYRNRFFFAREAGMWFFNLLELALVAWLLGGFESRGLALAGRYVQFTLSLWAGVTFAERILVGRYFTSRDPERVARVVATFIQAGVLGGLCMGLLLNALAPLMLGLSGADGPETALLFRHRAFLLLPEMMTSSWFAGAYTLARLYRPLSVQFTVRFLVLVSNVLLFPVWGVPVLVVNLYVPRLVDFAVTVWVARKWAFNPKRVPALPLFVLPTLDRRLINEMAPFVVGRCLGILFHSGYGLIILQAIVLILPEEAVFYVFFLQTMSLLYLLPRRLGRTVFFDVTQLLIANRLDVLRRHIRNMDRVALGVGIVAAALCLVLAFGLDRFTSRMPSWRLDQMRPLLLATFPLLLFRPQNELWQSIREASGELRFNNLLWFFSNYAVALPLNLAILSRMTGQLTTVESHGLEFVVVSRAWLFVSVIAVDGVMEAGRAVVSRIHGLRFKWALASPMRAARSALDSEFEIMKWRGASMSFSEGLAELWAERFLGNAQTGMASLPYWGCKVTRFLDSPHLRRFGFGLLKLTTDKRGCRQMDAGGRILGGVQEWLRPGGLICRVAPNRLLVFLPGVSPEELREAARSLSCCIGIHLIRMSWTHSSEGEVVSCPSLYRWALAVEWGRRGRMATAAPVRADQGDAEEAWQAASQLFFLRQGEATRHRELLAALLDPLQARQGKELITDAWIRDHAERLLSQFMGEPVRWLPLQAQDAPDAVAELEEDAHFLRRIAVSVERQRIPEFRKLLKESQRHLFPLFFRTQLLGAFVYRRLDAGSQMDMMRVAAGFYISVTWQSVSAVPWSDDDGLCLQPLFHAELRNAKQLKQLSGIPYAYMVVPRPVARQHGAACITAMREVFGAGAMVTRRRRKLYVLVPGLEQSRAEELLAMSKPAPGASSRPRCRDD